MLRLEEAENNLIIPVVNDIYLHSMQNPLKESQTFVDLHKESLLRNSNVLMLGLGFGYHVDAIEEFLKQHHKNYSIKVIEPNIELAQAFMDKRGFESDHIEVLAGTKVSAFFSDGVLINFLTTKPTILKHDSSFIASRTFFKDFLTFRASTNISDYYLRLNDFCKEILSQDLESSINAESERIKETGLFKSKADYFIMALSKINETENNL